MEKSRWFSLGGGLVRCGIGIGAVNLLVMLLTAASIWSNRLPYRFRYYAGAELKIGFGVAIALLVALGVAGVIRLVRRDVRAGVKLAAAGVAGAIIAGFLLVLGVLYDYLGPAKDHFADHLQLPDQVVLTTPAPPPGKVDFRQASPKSFQVQVLTADPKKYHLGDDEALALPALEKLTSAPELEAKLHRYLAANPEYRLYTDPRGGLHATRRFFDVSGKPVPADGGYYTYFGSNGDDRYTYRLDIGLDGLSWNGRLARSGAVIDPSHRGHSVSRLWAGKALVEITEESGQLGRPMTAKTIELLEKEFAEVLRSAAEPKGEKRKPELTLCGEKGVFIADFYCNPGEPGEIYLKAKEITEDIPLSSYRLKTLATERVGFSDNPDEVFPGQIRFTIYEGDWGQFYGMHLELHFRPDDPKGVPGKLLEGDFKIEGWMRSATP